MSGLKTPIACSDAPDNDGRPAPGGPATCRMRGPPAADSPEVVQYAGTDRAAARTWPTSRLYAVAAVTVAVPIVRSAGNVVILSSASSLSSSELATIIGTGATRARVVGGRYLPRMTALLRCRSLASAAGSTATSGSRKVQPSRTDTADRGAPPRRSGVGAARADQHGASRPTAT